MRLVALLLITLCAPLAVLALPRSETVAVVGSPWRGAAGAAEAIARAGGVVVRAGGASNVLVATSPDPDFVGRLYRSGAWLVLDPLSAVGCSTPSSQVEA